MNMKKTIALLLALIAVLGLFGCAKAGDAEAEAKTVTLSKASDEYIRIAYRTSKLTQRVIHQHGNDARVGSCQLEIRIQPKDAEKTTITGAAVALRMKNNSMWMCTQPEIVLSPDENGIWVGKTELSAQSLTPQKELKAPGSTDFEVELVSLEGTHTEP